MLYAENMLIKTLSVTRVKELATGITERDFGKEKEGIEMGFGTGKGVIERDFGTGKGGI